MFVINVKRFLAVMIAYHTKTLKIHLIALKNVVVLNVAQYAVVKGAVLSQNMLKT